MNLLRTSGILCAAAGLSLVCLSVVHAQDIPPPQQPPEVNAQDFNNPNLPPVPSAASPAPSAQPTNNVNLGTTPTGSTNVNLGTTQTNSGGGTQLLNPLGSNSNLPTLLTSILALVVRLGTYVVIFMLIYVGYLFVVARGAPTKIEEAKKALLWTVVGALILLGAQAISAGIQATAQSIGAGNTVTPNPYVLPAPTQNVNGQNVF